MINDLIFKMFEGDHGFDHGQAQTGYSVHRSDNNVPIVHRSSRKSDNKFIQNLKRRSSRSPGPVKIDSQRSEGRPTSPI